MGAIDQLDVFSDQEWRQVIEELELPPRQAQVARQVVRGRSDKQIAYELGITVPTVRSHVTRLFRRFDLCDRVELVLHVVACVRHRDRTAEPPPPCCPPVPRFAAHQVARP